MKKLNQHLYIYVIHGESIIYDRSMLRDCVIQADERIKELRKRGIEAFYTIGTIMPSAFY